MRFCVFFMFGILVFSQELELDSVVMSPQLPFTASEIQAKEIEKRNLGQDIPILLRNTPSVVSTSDAGAGVGYTGIRVRGSDAARINVTLDGVPINDSESHGVFWVNMPDLASSVQSIELQRGLGTSVNGSGAFGASLNVATQKPKKEAFLQLKNSYGSFNTRLHNVQIGTGELKNSGISAQGRISTILSDGYVDRASSDLFSYNAQIQYKKGKRSLRFNTFGGHEITYQSWFGIDRQTLETNRRFNPAGAILDSNGEITDFYPNQVDNYRQNHYHLHYTDLVFGGKLRSTLHYTRGKGFFEEYQNQANLEDYNLNAGVTDLVRRQWLDNDFYGGLLNYEIQKGNLTYIAGLAANQYDGDHFGRVIFAENITGFSPDFEYYRNVGLKLEFNTFLKAIYRWKQFELYGDLQYRSINYRTELEQDSPLEDFRTLDEDFRFWNPKAGITMHTAWGQIYGSYAFGQREPNRADFLDNEQVPTSEKLRNFELGFRKKNTQKWQLSANLYLMDYTNQLVPTGELNDVGTPLRANSGESYRLGLELESRYQLNPQLAVFGNLSASRNRNTNWTEDINGTTVNFGNTEIAFSPSFITNLGLEFSPISNLSLGLVGKFVSEQYMSNANFEESLLDAYSFADFNLQYSTGTVGFFDFIRVNLLVNNVFDQEFENNGFYFNFFDGNANDPRGLNHNPFFYPQAGINFLVGLSFGF